MSAGRYDFNSGRDDRPFLIKVNAVAKVETHDAADVLDFEGMRQFRVLHIAAGCILHLRFLKMEMRIRQFVKTADVIVVKMGQDAVANVGGLQIVLFF